MKEIKDFLLVIFLIILEFSFGFYLFELQGCFMMCKKIKIVFMIFIVVLTVLLLLIFGFCLFSNEDDVCNNQSLCFINGKFYINSNEIEDVYIISEENNSVPKNKKNIIVLNDITLKSNMFPNYSDDDFNKIENIYFFSSKQTVDEELYKKIKEKVKCISGNNKILQIEFNKIKEENNKL